MVASLAQGIAAAGHWLIAAIDPRRADADPTWWTVALATVLGAALGGIAIGAWRLLRPRLLARAAGDPRLALPLLQAVDPLLTLGTWLLAACLIAAPILRVAGSGSAPLTSALAWIASAALIFAIGRALYVGVGGLISPWRKRAAGTAPAWDDVVFDLAERIARSLVVFATLYLTTVILVVPPGAKPAVDTLLTLAVIATIAWFFVALVQIGDRYLRQRFRTDVADNLQARRVQTQLVVLRRLAYLVIGIVALSLALMQFEGIRRIGTSILASAGLAGVILGFAAQRTLANLLAGIQIALSQPVRIDDAVVIDGEFGRIEEITLTYIVVALWDQRRLIVPLSRIIDTSFQNWTRTDSQLLGAVTTRCDFHVPLDAMRDEAKRLIEGDARWDKRVFAFQVTDWAERTVEVRVLVSAANAGALFDLRCAVREGLLRWLSATHPEALPQLYVASSSPLPAPRSPLAQATPAPPS